MGEGEGTVLMQPAQGATLVAVLSNPPTTDGKRTMKRVILAAELLGFESVAIANIFSLATHATGDIDMVGATSDGWVAAREPLERSFAHAQGVLLAYGSTSPSGKARTHFREQVGWLQERIADLALQSWQVGDGPRHPSRWQRWTCRAHPDIPFAEALRCSLVPVRADCGAKHR